MKFLLRLALLPILLVNLLPVAWLALASLKDRAEIARYPTRLFPSEPTLGGFARILADTSIRRALITSLEVALPVTVLAIILAVFLSYATTRVRFCGWSLVERMAGVAYSFPPVFLALPLFLFFNRIGTVDNVAALGIAHLAYVFPLAYWLTLARVREIPRSADEVLLLDGGDFQDVLVHSWLPRLRLHLLGIGVIVFTVSMNDYVLARFLVISEIETLPLALQRLFDLARTDLQLIAAAGTSAITCLSIPVFLVVLAARGHHIGGARG